MKKEIINAGNSIHNAGAGLIGIVFISLLTGFIIYTQKNPEDLKLFLIVLALSNMVLFIYVGGSLIKAGKTMLNLSESNED
jgi:hypothetical protein